MVEHNPTEQSKRMIPTCLKREYRVAVTDEELALYQTLVDRHPHMLSEDYWPYESVCIEWGEREATWIDDLVRRDRQRATVPESGSRRCWGDHTSSPSTM